MAFERRWGEALDYRPCRYGSSKLVLRGPRKDLTGRYVAFLGGTETYGKFLRRPFPDLLEQALGCETVNLGCINAGTDVYLGDPTILSIARRGQAAVIQVMGAHYGSNRFYSVHPRRNDRFVAASPEMRARFPEVDFTDFAFTGHLVRALHDLAPERFAALVEELQALWVRRMRRLLRRIEAPRVVLWLSDHAPETGSADRLDADPLFVSRPMLKALQTEIDDLVEVVPGPTTCIRCTRCMVFPDLDAPAAAQTPGVAVHQIVARRLAPVIARHLS
ncbi:DUF6473 family protein [Tropicimonas sp. IMCC34043]|uniref:DUF6473 family protein n=1 Tax=Tropicimonas sp. IMCC34043 TaxID=2248760 RepID=UPI000E26786F|nr:DUF6473 family protein [Tropicimonas sp. IMCC34043]